MAEKDEDQDYDAKLDPPSDTDRVGGSMADRVCERARGLVNEKRDPRRKAFRSSNAASNETTEPEPGPFRVRLYHPGDLLRSIRDLTGERDEFEWSGSESGVPQTTETHLSNEETLRLRRLRLIGDDPRGPWRSLIHGTQDMIERLAAVRAQAPHFAPFVDHATRAVHVAIATGTAVRLPPTLLLGEPGIGKTWILKKVAVALGSSFTLLPMNLTDSFRLRGLNTAWKGARPGRIAEILLTSESASPVVLLDELEKTPALDKVDRPFDIWHSLWEPENSTSFVDDFYEIPFRADRVIWIASANSTDELPDSICDRLLVLRILSADAEQALVIIEGLYRAARERLGGRIAESLDDNVRVALACLTPRRAARILDLAIGFMATDGRISLAVEDVDRAGCMVSDARSSGTFRHPVGSIGSECR